MPAWNVSVGSILFCNMTDTYNTITLAGEGIYTEKRSKFLAFAHHADSVEQAKLIVDGYRKKYYDARHCCYAYKIGLDAPVMRANDDGEPSSTAGKPILGQIVSHGLDNVVVCVVRYYGGVNLGTGGLIVAYRTAAAAAIDNSNIEEKEICEQVNFRFDYTCMNNVMRVVKDLNAKVVEQKYGNDCTITLKVRRSLAPQLRNRLEQLRFA